MLLDEHLRLTGAAGFVLLHGTVQIFPHREMA